MGAKKTKNMSKTAAKLVVIREVDKNEGSKGEMAQTYGMPLCGGGGRREEEKDSTEHQVLHGHNILKHMRILGAKHGNMEHKLFEWFRHARENRLPVDGQMVKVKADEIALKMGINFKCSNRWTQHLKREVTLWY